MLVENIKREKKIQTAQREDLVHPRYKKGEEYTQKPHAESVDRHRRVINTRHSGAHFWIRRLANRTC
jgi:hypothetical protein